MRHPLFQKCLLLLIIGMLLMIPLRMIQSVIDERTMFRHQATQAIAAATAGTQSIAGPLLIFPVDEYFDDISIERHGGQTTKRVVRSVIRHQVVATPKQLHFDGDMKVERRAYGLYDTSVFSLRETISGNFETPDASALPKPGANARLVWGSPVLVLGVGDPRGIDGEPKVSLAGRPLQLRHGTRLAESDMRLPDSVPDAKEAAAAVASQADETSPARAFNIRSGFKAVGAEKHDGRPATVPFTITLNLSGTSDLTLIPLSETTTAELRSDWPHPRFGGNYLPRSREVGEQGVSARWSTTAATAGSRRRSARAAR